MTAFRVGKVVSVEFPFTDMQGRKRRPGVVLAIDSTDLLLADGKNEKGRPRKRSGVADCADPQARSLTWTAVVLSGDHRRITANQVGAEVDQTAGGGETCGRFIAIPAERYPASDGVTRFRRNTSS